MNIDTSALSANTETASFMSSSKNRKIHGGNAFSSQLKTLQIDSDSDVNKVAKRESSVEEEVVENSKHEDSTPEVKPEQKVENKAPEKAEDSTAEQQSHAQNQQGQQGQNQESAELSEEILSVMKANGKLVGVDGVNNFKLVSGISEDVYTTFAKIDYSTFSMSDDDALFFASLVSKTDMSMQSIAGEFKKALQAGNIEQVQKTAKVSSVLLEALADSMKTNKAFRIDFDKDISVVMRVDKDGNLNANFIPGDKAVEAYLRNNISYLKQRFEEQNISYGELTYSKHKRQDQDEEKQDKKENSHE
ncbi:hypothetical protein IKU74_01920 [bacterium]|nr:hypothetical protein [bacterium]